MAITPRITTLLQHPDLGAFRGVVENGVRRFLGIKYAFVRDRLAPAQLVESYGEHGQGNYEGRAKDGVFDASRQGPTVIYPAGEDALDEMLPKREKEYQSGVHGLNANITLPVLEEKNGIHPQSRPKLPVLVYIHGGGFKTGSNASTVYDLANLIRLAVEMGQPFIGVQINYRLGWLGSLRSSELIDAGYPGNNAIRDQRAGLRWVKRFIGGFGGDRDNMTIMGESAGGASVTHHLASEEPLFRRMASMCGTPLVLPTRTPEEGNEAYTTALTALGVQDRKTPAERIRGILEAPIQDLCDKWPVPSTMTPVREEGLIGDVLNYDNIQRARLPGVNWCEEAIYGESQNDASVLGVVYLQPRLKGLAKQFIETAQTVLAKQGLPPESADALLAAYGITASLADTAALLATCRFLNDVIFYMANLAFAAKFPAGKARVYHFNEPAHLHIDVEPFKGLVNHCTDNIYALQNFNPLLKGDQLKLSREFGELFVKFVNGKPTWPPYVVGKGEGGLVLKIKEGQESAMVYQEGLDATLYGREETIHELSKVVKLQDLYCVACAFLPMPFG